MEANHEWKPPDVAVQIAHSSRDRPESRRVGDLPEGWRLGLLFGVVALVVHAELRHLAIEIGAVHTELFSGSCQIAFCGLNMPTDVVFLEYRGRIG